MSTPDVGNIIQVPGRLSHSPTSLSTAYPHGGTAIGLVGRIDLRPAAAAVLVTAEEFGGVVSDAVYGGEDWILRVTLREVLDADALAAVFPIYVAGAAGGAILRADANSSVRAGSYLGDLAKVILFTPDNADQHPWLIVRRGVPAIDEAASIPLRANEEAAIRLAWHCTPDSAGKQFEFGRRRDITL